MDRTYTIYRIWNLINRKVYIGRTTTPLKSRWAAHKSLSKKNNKNNKPSYISNTIKKYGIENFGIKTIATARSFSEMRYLECYFIKYYQSHQSQYGYNLVIQNPYESGFEFISEKNRVRNSRLRQQQHKRKTIGIRAVGKSHSKFHVRIRLSLSKTIIRKNFNSLPAAKEFYDKLALYIYGDCARINNEEVRQQYLSEDLKLFYENVMADKNHKEKLNGIVFHNNHWEVSLCVPIGESIKRRFLGNYSSEQEALIVCDKIGYYLYGPFYKIRLPEKFDEKTYTEDGKNIFDFYVSVGRKGTKKTKLPKSSKYKGVKRHGRRWVAGLMIKGQKWRQSLKTEKEAALAFNQKVKEAGLPEGYLNIIED